MVALILCNWVKKGDTVIWKNSSFLSAPQLTSWTGYSNGFSLSSSDLHNRQMNSSDWIGLDGGKKHSKRIRKWRKLKGVLFYFSHWNNYRINLPFQCDSLLNPLCQSVFDVLGSLWKWLDSFGDIKIALVMSSALGLIPVFIPPLVPAGQLDQDHNAPGWRVLL